MNTLLPRRLTWTDVVRQELGESVPEAFAGCVLWNETAYPFAGVEYIRRQVRGYRDNNRQEEQ